MRWGGWRVRCCRIGASRRILGERLLMFSRSLTVLVYITCFVIVEIEEGTVPDGPTMAANWPASIYQSLVSKNFVARGVIQELTVMFKLVKTGTSRVGYLKDTFLSSTLTPCNFSFSKVEFVMREVSCWEGRMFRMPLAAANADAMSAR